VRAACVAIGLAVVPAACGDEETSVVASPCFAGAAWELGDTPSPEMSPGEPCLGCHDDFAAAGTVFEALHDPDDCLGAAGVTVEIEDADRVVASVVTNASGNFFVPGKDSLRLPVIARVLRDGELLLMPRYVQSGDCNDCHTQNGRLSAPGRIHPP
jgi:hypothetical protein